MDGLRTCLHIHEMSSKLHTKGTGLNWVWEIEIEEEEALRKQYEMMVRGNRALEPIA